MLLVILFTGCGGPNELVSITSSGGDISGFWGGLWDGMTIIFSWFFSLFNENITIYEVHNNGEWYQFGFMIGSVFLPIKIFYKS